MTCHLQHGGPPPKTIAEKAEFRTLIDSFRSYEEEDNFDEAVRNYTQALGTTTVTPDLEDVFNAEAATALDCASEPFWFVVAAIREFYETRGYLPLSGELPDMTATTDLYVELQRIYQHQAALDVLAVTAKVHELQSKIGAPADHTAADTISLMCKNAQHLRVLRSHSLLGELSLDSLTKEYDDSIGCVLPLI
jgi:amyloid beta precursor protein binding protein 1